MGDISPHNTVNNKSVLLFVRIVLTKHMSIGPGQLKGLPHDEAAKDLVEPDCNRFQFMLFDIVQTCSCSEVGKQQGFSTWRLQTRQSCRA